MAKNPASAGGVMPRSITPVFLIWSSSGIVTTSRVGVNVIRATAMAGVYEETAMTSIRKAAVLGRIYLFIFFVFSFLCVSGSDNASLVSGWIVRMFGNAI